MLIRRRKLFISIALIVVLLIAGVGVWWFTHQPSTSSKQDQGGVTLVKLSSDDLINKVNTLRAGGKFADAQKLIEYQDNYKDGSFTTVMYAQILGMNGHVDTALQILKDAEGTRDNKYSYRGYAAGILAQAGKKTEAIAYYQQAIDLAKTFKPADDTASLDVGSAIGDYEASIAQLEAAK